MGSSHLPDSEFQPFRHQGGPLEQGPAETDTTTRRPTKTEASENFILAYWSVEFRKWCSVEWCVVEISKHGDRVRMAGSPAHYEGFGLRDTAIEFKVEWAP